MLHVIAVQTRPQLFELRANLQAIYEISENAEAELIVFPELATCGYFFHSFDQSRSVALSIDSQEMQKLQEISTRRNIILVVGFAELADDGIYNSAALFMPDAALTRVYRKTHLFYKEKFCFQPGNSGFFVVHDPIRDIRIGVMICYDWRFPESARSLTLLGADVIVCPSNLVTHIWRSVMPTRAIENKVYLVVANRWGSETQESETVSFNGQSCIYSYNGEVLAACGAEGDALIKATLDPLKTRDKSFYAENDILLDRRPELYLNRVTDSV